MYPYCLSDRNGATKFHINFDPYTSSLYPFNKEYGSRYEVYEGYDYLYEHSLKTEKTIDVEAVSLDYLIENKIVNSPDFLSIDTQGAELSILKGAINALKSTTIAVMCEVNFVELYNGIPLFGDLDSFMRSMNFILATLKPFDVGYNRISEDCRGKGMPVQGEALYYRDPKFITGSNEVVKTQLEKLAFASIVFGFTELANEAIERASEIPEHNARNLGYQVFLKQLKVQFNENNSLPKLWNDSVTFEESVKRFDANKDSDTAAPLSNNIFKYKIKRFVKLVLRTLSIPIPGSKLNKLELFLRVNGLQKAADEVNKQNK